MLAMIIWLQEINVNAKSISTLYGLFKSQSRIDKNRDLGGLG